MKLSSRFALALLLGTALATTFTACDSRWSPGKNPQFTRGFSNPPGWHTADVNRDSINNQQPAAPATGEGAKAPAAAASSSAATDGPQPAAK